MARTTRTGLNAAAWFYGQSFHTITPATPAPVTTPAPLATAAPFTQFLAGILLDALHDNREHDARILAERDEELEANWRAEREGDACGPACGYCGRCS